MTFMWTDRNENPAVGKEGGLAIAPFSAPKSRCAEGAIRAGLLVQNGTDPETQVKAMAALPAADADSISVGPLATAATEQTFSGATDFDGAIGVGKILPPQRLSFTLNSHADWDATSMTVVGLDGRGEQISEQVAIPDAGNATVYTTNAYSQLLYLVLPAQSGTNGSMTVGTDPDVTTLNSRDYGVAIYDRAREASDTATVTFDDDETLSVLHHGQIWVITETAVTPHDRVGVRVVESGGDVRGQFAKMPSEAPASLAFAVLEGARFKTSASADGLAIVELDG